VHLGYARLYLVVHPQAHADASFWALMLDVTGGFYAGANGVARQKETFWKLNV
jgi:hypothetical protein